MAFNTKIFCGSSDLVSRFSSKINTEIRKRTKSSYNKFEFEESNAQIFRLMLDDAHLQSCVYFYEYQNAFTFSLVVVSSQLLQKYLNSGSKESGSLANGGFVPVLLGFMGVFKFLTLLAKVSFEKLALRRPEKQLSVLFGALGAIAGNMVCFLISPSVLDFNFSPLDGFSRVSIAVLMGCLVGFLFMPATKSVRAFWLGTDQSRSNLAMISCGWFARLILYANYLVILFTAILWIKPLLEMLVNKNIGDGKDVHLVNKVGHLERLFGSVGILSLMEKLP
ncbi:uncharacterized protein LOC107433830 [Ziziphus jujuba]|uniref:Uncharacterized protein LOC107433830 n=1 Tax=Ziziphus jujuba TaxID=326968 RepID=A0ABM4AGX2_ZIZJJ|nr:uncharacterized protein LOC107433830 [Ziziphus jujuba]